jgi:hypothetical protein
MRKGERKTRESRVRGRKRLGSFITWKAFWMEGGELSGWF